MIWWKKLLLNLSKRHNKSKHRVIRIVIDKCFRGVINALLLANVKHDIINTMYEVKDSIMESDIWDT